MRSIHHRRKVAKKYIGKRLLIQLRIFLLIFVIMAMLIIFDIYQHIISISFASVGVLIGVIVGFIMGKTANLVWHEEETKIVSKLDIAGSLVLIFYIIFALSRNWIFGHWIDGPSLSAFGFAVASGTMLGRLIGTGHGIGKLLDQKGIIR